MTRGCWLSADDMKRAVDEYGVTLTPLPSRALDELDAIEVEGSEVPTFDVVVDLWSKEGRTDLSLSLRLVGRFRGAYDVEICDLHVL